MLTSMNVYPATITPRTWTQIPGFSVRPWLPGDDLASSVTATEEGVADISEKSRSTAEPPTLSGWTLRLSPSDNTPLKDAA